MNNTQNQLLSSLRTSYLDKESLSDYNFQTELLINDYKRGTKVLNHMQRELIHCNEFMISVAFITEGGLTVLANQLLETQANNTKGRIVTSSYLQFNDPKTYRKLLTYPNIDVRVYEDQPLHSKGYVFRHDDVYNLILGSSNLTQAALTVNQEWNIKLSSLKNGKIINDTVNEFELMWSKATILNEKWIQEYEKTYIKKTYTETPIIKNKHIIPNKMQTEALRNLDTIRTKGENKALLISSTGTGKTYLAAFDVKNFKAKRFLFVVHREQIAKDAMNSFKRIMPGKSYGLISGNIKDYKADYIFTTVQTLSRDRNRIKFSEEHFDYIVIDEAHRSGAESYLKILDYFKPEFLLGMTATPERTDAYDIFQLFDYNIAYEIRLQEALEEDMLCPFHYFGVSDITIDNQIIDDFSDTSLLLSEERINHILKQSKYYGYSGDHLAGLIFVSRNEEATLLEEKLNKRGLKTLALSGKNSQYEREMSIDRLVRNDGDLDYLITVDIFNEGIDIPEVNQIIMLRPTQSAIIFVQQLGRGLRKQINKDYVVIIDFIGNYKNNFFIPIALSGDNSNDKDKIKEFIVEGTSNLPGSSTIDFDEITRERIYESVNRQNFSTIANLKTAYFALKNKIGRIPKLTDYIQHKTIDPEVIFKHQSFNNYHNFLQRMDADYTLTLNEYQDKSLSFITLEFSNGMRLEEIKVIEALLKNDHIISYPLFKEICSNQEVENSMIRLFTLEFFVSTDYKKYGAKPILNFRDKTIGFNSELSYNLKSNIEFYRHFLGVIELAKLKNHERYLNPIKSSNMVLYEKYSKKQMCRLMNWDQDEKGTIYGYRFKHNTFPIFVTYHKDENIADSIKYNDHFINPQTFSWMTRNQVRLDSIEVSRLKKATKKGIPAQLFIQKEDSEKGQFYYMGEMFAKDYSQETIISKNKDLPIVNIIFELKNPVRADIYDFIVKN